MFLNKILKAVLLLLGGTYIVLQGLAFEVESAAVSALMLVLLTVLYCGWTEKKNKFFFSFLVTFAVANVLSYLSWYAPEVIDDETDYFYYLANILYIISYVFLIVRMIRVLDIKAVFSELPIPIVVLVILDIFCVSIVSSTTEGALVGYEYNLEFAYNAVIMALLSVALINYMYRNDNKSMLFLLASIFIVFSEIIQLADYYIVIYESNLGFVYSLFLVVAFLFFHLQSQHQFTGPEPSYTDEQLET